MMTFFKHFKTEVMPVPQSTRRTSLTRSFVETGDERCPLAGIWSRLPEMDAAVGFESDDEPGLTRLVREGSCLERFLGEPFVLCHLTFIHLQYRID